MSEVRAHDKISWIEIRARGEKEDFQILSLTLLDQADKAIFDKKFASDLDDCRKVLIDVPEDETICGIDSQS